jgi:hypothetical protein
VTDWEPTTITTSLTGGSGITVTAFEKRVGDTAYYTGKVSWTTVWTGGSFRLNLPRIIDDSKINIGVVTSPLGRAILSDASFASYEGEVISRTTSQVEIRFIDPAQNNRIFAISTTVPMTWADADYVEFNFSVPILGWSSNTVMSEDAGNREIVANLSSSSALGLTSTLQKIPFLTISKDTTNSWNPVTNQYEIPESGVYDINSQYFISSGSTGFNGTSASIEIAVYNGTSSIRTNQRRPYASEEYPFISINTSNYFEKGDLISIQAKQTSATTPLPIGTTTTGTFFSIAKRSSPQTIAASEKVYGFANTDGVANGVFVTTIAEGIIFDNKVSDSHGALNTSTGIITAPKSGVLSLSASVNITSSSNWAAGEQVYIQVKVGGTTAKIYWEELESSTPSLSISLNIDLVGYPVTKGQEIQVQLRQYSGSDQSLTTASNYNTLSWEIN